MYCSCFVVTLLAGICVAYVFAVMLLAVHYVLLLFFAVMLFSTQYVLLMFCCNVVQRSLCVALVLL